ncbi:MAG TPA: cytochrome c peroxidase [Gemmatimonadales bacterium]|nr:cytochrome c peroxidase [Gemmatimonadales bacterium]
MKLVPKVISPFRIRQRAIENDAPGVECEEAVERHRRKCAASGHGYSTEVYGGTKHPKGWFSFGRGRDRKVACCQVRAAALNAPALAVVSEDDPTVVIPPRGLQVIEALVFPRPGEDFTRRAASEVQRARLIVGLVRHDAASRSRAWELPFRAARAEVARVVTLGLAGFDATVSKDGVPESGHALRGVQEGLGIYEAPMLRSDPAGWHELQRALEAGIAALEGTSDFDRFDRLGFVTGHAHAITRGLARLQRGLRLAESSEPEPWSPGATDIFAAAAIDAGWFAPDFAPEPTPGLVALGRELFSDPRLSGTRRRSCATCHRPELAFSDGRALALVDEGHGIVRNTPTLLNAGLQLAQFADQRAAFLELQFADVMANPREMALEPEAAVRRLATDTAILARFAKAFGRPAQEALTEQSLSVAVAAYVRSLEATSSRFDRAVRGDTAAITASERRGFNLFMGKAACGTCHFAPLFGGTLPPAFMESEPEVIGVPERAGATPATVDEDPGVFAVDSAPLHRHAFKTPTVRNVGLTAPYMHNGVFRTLEEVVDFYDAGGGNGLGMGLPNQTLSADSLGLSPQEKRDLVSFMHALTDSSSLR